jgi:hypothetical protein
MGRGDRTTDRKGGRAGGRAGVFTVSDIRHYLQILEHMHTDLHTEVV